MPKSKDTVEYFPHYCTNKTTMFVLEDKYLNDGYALWFKLLELLGNSHGHFIDCKLIPTWKYLVARTRLTEEKVIEILDLLAELDAIDKELWNNKILWSDNFIEGIRPVYEKRKRPVPLKPTLNGHRPMDYITGTVPIPLIPSQPVTETTPIPLIPSQPVTESGGTRAKVKYSKVKYSIVDSVNNIYNHWNNKEIIIHKNITVKIVNKIKSTLKDYSDEDILNAISNYALVVNNTNDKYFFNYRWTLVDFLQRGLDKFMDNAKPLQNYLYTTKGKPQIHPPRVLRNAKDVVDNDQ